VSNNPLRPIDGAAGAGWAALLGIESEKDQLLAWAALSLHAARLSRVATGLNRFALVQGPPGTGKTTMARGLGQALQPVVGQQVAVIDFSSHAVMSGEHGRTQRDVHRVLAEDVPEMAAGRPAVLVIDEVEAVAMPRGAVSLEANPVDVHRTTDALITALDELADAATALVIVATTNYPELVDGALRSRADVTITVPAPNADAVHEILVATLREWGRVFTPLGKLADDTGLRQVAEKLATQEVDARQARKFVMQVLASDSGNVQKPERVTVSTLMHQAGITAAVR
jgi:AAA+ superfamily predicted ATPase